MTATDCDPGPLTALAVKYLNEFMQGAAAPVAAPEYRDALVSPTGRRGAIQWFPSDSSHGDHLGFVCIEMPDDVTTYSVSARRCGAERAFFLTKHEGTGRGKRPAVLVRCAAGRPYSCECESRGPTCKHKSALLSMLSNGWIAG